MTNDPSGSGAALSPVAPISRRAIAYVIDAAIASVLSTVGVLASVLLAASGGRSEIEALAGLGIGLGITTLVLLAWFLVYSFLQGAGGSIGMRVMSLRLVRDGSGEPLGFGRALLRNVVFGLSAAIVVGYFSPLFDGSGRFQGWHDRAAGALMRDVRGAAPAAGAASSSAPETATPSYPSPASAPAAMTFAPGGASSAAQPLATADAVPSAHTGHTLPATPGGGAAPAVAEADPHEATVLSPRIPTVERADDDAMITTVPGVSAAVHAPAPTSVSGPEATPVGVAAASPAPAPVPSAAPAATPAPLTQSPEDDEDPEETRISIPGHRLQFVWDDGARATVSGRTLFGRNPAPEAGAAVVVVRDETLSLSKTHFEAAAEASGGWVMDRHSTNGMTIVRDGVRIACPPGERVRIRLGDAIEIGDRIVTVGGYA